MICNLLTLSTSAFVNRFMPRHKLAYVNPIIHYAKRETLLNMIQSAEVNENTFSDLSKWIMVNNVRRSQLCIFYIYMYINYVTFLAHTKIISFNNVHVIIDIAICIRYLLVSNLMIFKISIIIDLNQVFRASLGVIASTNIF
jgi:hypothetical protein